MTQWSDIPSLWSDMPDNWLLLERRRISGGGSVTSSNGHKSTGGSARISGAGDIRSTGWKAIPRDITIVVHAPVLKRVDIENINRTPLPIEGPTLFLTEETITISSPIISAINTELTSVSSIISYSPIKKAISITQDKAPAGLIYSAKAIDGILSIEKPLFKSTISSVELIDIVQISVDEPIIDRE